MAERSAQLAGSLPRLGERLRVNQVANRFSLGQIEPAGQKSALGELSGLSQARAAIQRAAQQKLQNHRRAVCGNLHQVFRCVGVRRGKEGHERLVDARGMSARGWGVFGIEHIGQARVGMFEGLVRPHELQSDGRSLRPAETHNPDAAPPWRRGDGGDGVGCSVGHSFWLHSV